MDNKMFCYQCQEAANCKGCIVVGVCGKKPEVAAMQDLLIYVTKGLAAVAANLRKDGKSIPPEINHIVTFNMFMTITNANFDEKSIRMRIRMTLQAKDKLSEELISNVSALPKAAQWRGEGDWEEKAKEVGVLSLGIKNIHLGPTLPAFLSPNVTNVLVEKLGIAGINGADEDINLFFGNN